MRIMLFFTICKSLTYKKNINANKYLSPKRLKAKLRVLFNYTFKG